MKKRRILVAFVLFAIAIACLFLSKGNLVPYAYAGSCQYCAWDNENQEYNCEWYEGPGYFLCHAHGTNCSGMQLCDIPI